MWLGLEIYVLYNYICVCTYVLNACRISSKNNRNTCTYSTSSSWVSFRFVKIVIRIKKRILISSWIHYSDSNIYSEVSSLFTCTQSLDPFPLSTGKKSSHLSVRVRERVSVRTRKKVHICMRVRVSEYGKNTGCAICWTYIMTWLLSVCESWLLGTLIITLL